MSSGYSYQASGIQRQELNMATFAERLRTLANGNHALPSWTLGAAGEPAKDQFNDLWRELEEQFKNGSDQAQSLMSALHATRKSYLHAEGASAKTVLTALSEARTTAPPSPGADGDAGLAVDGARGAGYAAAGLGVAGAGVHALKNAGRGFDVEEGFRGKYAADFSPEAGYRHPGYAAYTRNVNASYESAMRSQMQNDPHFQNEYSVFHHSAQEEFDRRFVPKSYEQWERDAYRYGSTDFRREVDDGHRAHAKRVAKARSAFVNERMNLNRSEIAKLSKATRTSLTLGKGAAWTLIAAGLAWETMVIPSDEELDRLVGTWATLSYDCGSLFGFDMSGLRAAIADAWQSGLARDSADGRLVEFIENGVLLATRVRRLSEALAATVEELKGIHKVALVSSLATLAALAAARFGSSIPIVRAFSEACGSRLASVIFAIIGIAPAAYIFGVTLYRFHSQDDTMRIGGHQVTGFKPVSG